MKLEITKCRSWDAGERGRAFSASLSVDGVHAAQVDDDGSRVPLRFAWVSKEIEAKVISWIVTQDVVQLGIAKSHDELYLGRPVASFYERVSDRLDAHVNNLLDEFLRRRQLRKLAREAVLFHLPGDTMMRSVALNGRTVEQVRALLLAEYRVVEWVEV